MPEEMKNAALSGECKIVPVAQLKKWHRDMDACQKVIWLRGGFDPAYCMDAQDCLKEMDSVLAAPAPPAGGVQFIGYPPVPEDRRLPPTGGEPGAVEGLRQLVIGPYPDPDVEDAHDEYLDEHQSQALWLLRNAGRIETHITRLQAENAVLQQRLNVADQRNDDLQSELTKARELLAEASAWIKSNSCHGTDAIDLWERLDSAHQSAPAACWTPENHECPGDGIGACKKCPNAPAAKCETCEGTGHDLDGGMNPMGGAADCLDCGGRGTAAKGVCDE